MSVAGAPIPLTPGQSVTVKSGLPAPGLGSVLGVVLQNLSSYLLTVSIGGNAYSLAPWTADAFPLNSSGVPVTVTPASAGTTDPAGVAAVRPTWLTSTDDADELAGAYPATLPISPATTSSLSASAAQIAAALADTGALNANGIAAALATNNNLTGAGIAAALATNNNLTAAGVAAQIAVQGSPVLQSSGLIYNDAPTLPNGNSSRVSPVQDVGSYQTVIVNFNPTADAGATAAYLIQLEWVDRPVAPTVMDQHKIVCSGWLIGQLPVMAKVAPRSRYLRVRVFTTQPAAGATYTLNVWGYTGANNRDTVHTYSSTVIGSVPRCPPILLDGLNMPNLAPGGTVNYMLGPVTSLIRFRVEPTATASNLMQFDLAALEYDPSTGTNNWIPFQRNFNQVNTAGNSGTQATIEVPWGTVMRLAITNLGTGNISPPFYAYDASGMP